MLLIRPVTMGDHAAVMALALEAGTGMTSLPPDADVLAAKIARAERSFATPAAAVQEGTYLFVLEDTASGQVVGTAGLTGRVGTRMPFYSYKLSTITQASDVLKVYSAQQVLHMVNDYTGAACLGSLFLLPAYRRDGVGRFLSRSRYLPLAEFPERFGERVIAELRGVQLADGSSPFYDHLARHFFQVDFQEADYVSATRGNQFIADLMPKYPIYVTLLPQAARDVIGEPHEESRAAMHLLARENFRYEGYVDVFDAGPTLQAYRTRITTVQASRTAMVQRLVPSIPEDAPLMMLMTAHPDTCRITRARVLCPDPASLHLDDATARVLGVHPGDRLRVVE